MAKTQKSTTQTVVECALMIAIATVLNVVCSFIPFLNLPYGTTKMRGRDGAWYEVTREDKGEEAP